MIYYYQMNDVEIYINNISTSVANQLNLINKYSVKAMP